MTAPPGAAVNEHHDRGRFIPGRINVEHLMRGGPIGHSHGRTEALTDEFAYAGTAPVHLIAIWCVDRLVVGIVKLVLIHIEPDEGSLLPRCALLCSGAGRNDGGGRAYNGPTAHQISFAAIVIHRSSTPGTAGVSPALCQAGDARAPRKLNSAPAIAFPEAR